MIIFNRFHIKIVPNLKNKTILFATNFFTGQVTIKLLFLRQFFFIFFISLMLLHKKTPHFPGPGISWKDQKHQVNIIFPSTFWLKVRSYFRSPKSSKQEILSNQQILISHQLLDSKKDRISHDRKIQNKGFSVISKHHLFHQLLCSKKTIFPITEKFKTRAFQ